MPRFPIPLKWIGVSLWVAGLHAAPESIEPLIRINQIGYLPDGNKVAVIADPQEGPDADLAFTPGQIYEVRRWADDAVVFVGEPVSWNNGITHPQSGDRGWWFDFSEFTEPGEYYIWDADQAVGSHGFEIRHNVYNGILKAAIRTFFYQRLGFEKPAAFAGADWADGAAFLGSGQDTECRNVYDRNNPDSARDLRGGWMDAGDTNKYVTFAEAPVHQLLHAYQENPAAFGDDLKIPESGNGIPDLLDEVHFEMQWMARMQEADGGVLQKMGEIDFNGSSPPSSDTRPRFYVPSCSSSSIAAAGMYAHAALVFRDIEPWIPFARRLEAQAESAWAWYHANPKSDNCDEQIVKAGDADRSLEDQKKSALIAAMFLHRLTGDDAYRTYVEENFEDPDIELLGWAGQTVYSVALFESALHYIEFEEAPDSMVSALRAHMLNIENDLFLDWNADDLYRGFMPDDQYHWGSNFVRSNIANSNLNFHTFGIQSADLEIRNLRAENMLHYLLGVNPLGLVYLSNMGAYGAEVSVEQFYHSWFSHGSEWDLNPPPGYLPGGPNKNYTGNYPGLADAPPQKAYAEINGGFSQSWELTENAIYYQAAFIKMLSKFVAEAQQPTDAVDPDRDGLANTLEAWFGLDPLQADGLGSRISVDLESQPLRLIFSRRASANPDRVTPKWSTDLQAWSAFDMSTAVTLEPAGAGLATFALPIETGDAATVFIRFEAGEPTGFEVPL